MQERNYFVSKMEDVEVRSALRLEYIQDLCYWFEDNLNLVSLLQSNLDYSKWQGPKDSFRIIGSSNDRKREFSDIFRKARMLSKSVIVLPEFATSTHVFCEVIGTSTKALKKMSSLEVVASSSLMLCRSKNAEN